MKQPLKILLLEDSSIDAEIIQRVLLKEKMNCEFHLAMEKKFFLQALDDFSPHVILSDNSLPQFNATDALKIVRERGLQIPFIMVTGTMTEEFAAVMIKSGADDYIIKDRLARLPAAIKTALSQRQSEKEKIEAIQKLSANEEKYRTLVERISDGFIAMDLDWRITYINQVAEQLLLRPTGYLVGKKVTEEYPEGIGGAIFKAYQQASETGNAVYLEEYSVILDRWIRASIYPSSTGVSIFFRDITEQRKAEEEAKKSEEKYRIFIQRITDAFIAVDKNWRYTYLNKQAGELIRRQPADLIGKNVWTEFPDAIGSASYEAFHKAMKEQVYVTNIDYYQPLNLWQENHIYPSPDGLSIFIRDITEKKALENELQEQQRKEQFKLIAATLEAQEKERNAIGIELHDNVNQILVGTKLFLQIIRDDPAKVQNLIGTCLTTIQDAIDENRKIAHVLVSPDFEFSTLSDQIADLANSMLNAAGMQVTIDKTDLQEKSLMDEQKLTIYRMAQEQCTNIVKYAKARSVRISLSTEDDIFNMTIADDGTGMDANKKPKGIGLKNIRGRLSIFNGTAVINTSPGKGFTLIITMPIKK